MHSQQVGYVGVDVGTSACKAVLIAGNGRQVQTHTSSYPTRRRLDGEVSQDPDDWLSAVRRSVRSCTLAGDGLRIQGIAVTAPAHVGVLVGEDGTALARALLAFDGRAAGHASEMRDRYGPALREKTFVDLSPGWTLPQLAWQRSAAPELWPRISKLLTQKDFVRFHLTGEALIDRTDAAGTAMFDQIAGTWIEQVCRDVGLGEGQMPPIRSSFTNGGGLTPSWAHALGMATGTPVVVGATDTAAELISIGAVEPGRSLVKIASTGTVVVVSDRPVVGRAVMTYPHAMDDRWYSIAATSSAAVAFGWLSHLLNDGAGGLDLRAMDRLAARIGPGSDGALFLPFLDGERSPYWDRDLRAAFLGLSSAHGRPHLCRAVLEGVAYSLRVCRDAMRDLDLTIDRPTLGGGGTESRVWREILVAVLGQEVRALRRHGPALGSALIAMAVDAGTSPAALADLAAKGGRVVTPRADWVAPYDRQFKTYQAAVQATTEISHLASQT